MTLGLYDPITLDGGRILLSNDDGVLAPGLKALHRIAKTLVKDVWICAPETEQSGAGHSLTLRRPLRIRQVGPKRYAVDGTPTDSVLLGIRQVMQKHRPSLMLSGVNRGSNIAEDMTYSGTIAAAMEATLLGIPAIALSLHVSSGMAPRWETAEAHGPDLIRRLITTRWPKNVMLNVNFPDCAPEDVKGIVVTRQGSRKMGEQLGQRTDMRGEHYYWIGPMSAAEAPPTDTDVAAVFGQYISVTPLNLDLTDEPTSAALRDVLGAPLETMAPA
ncbi:MAG: 5'/3'-nucleotidase SurE [Elstera sp.]